MKDANFDEWTKTESVAEKIKTWVETKEYPLDTFIKVQIEIKLENIFIFFNI